MALAYVLLIKYLLILGHVIRVSFLNVNHFAHPNREILLEFQSVKQMAPAHIHMPIIKYLLILGHVMRVSFLNVNHFAHLNREMVKEEFDVALKVS